MELDSAAPQVKHFNAEVFQALAEKVKPKEAGQSGLLPERTRLTPLYIMYITYIYIHMYYIICMFQAVDPPLWGGVGLGG